MLPPDITFRVEGEDYKAHRFVLVARSDWFTRVLSAPRIDEDGAVIMSDRWTYEAFDVAVRYLYAELPQPQPAGQVCN